MTRRPLTIIPALLLAGLATACGGGGGKPAAVPSAVTVLTPSAQASTSPAAAPSKAPSASPAKPSKPVPTCAEVKESMLYGSVEPYQAFGKDGAPLTEGMFSGEDGLVLVVQPPCASGDLTGLGPVTVGVVMSSVVDTTGRYWAIATCVKGSDRARCTVRHVLNDRDPVQSVAVSGGRLTLVYLTRPDGAGSAAVSVRRTAVYAVTGATLTEVSHTDEPYTP